MAFPCIYKILALTSFPNYLSYTAACSSFNINYPPMRTLLRPGDTITYTCSFSSSAYIVSTLWLGSGFKCTPPGLTANAITLTQGSNLSPNPSVESCGSLSAVMTNVRGTCYTSVLTIPTPEYFNGTTFQCRDGTLNIQLACKLVFKNQSPMLKVHGV